MNKGLKSTISGPSVITDDRGTPPFSTRRSRAWDLVPACSCAMRHTRRTHQRVRLEGGKPLGVRHEQHASPRHRGEPHPQRADGFRAGHVPLSRLRPRKQRRSVIAASGARSADAKTLHKRPATIQELQWRAPYVTSTRHDGRSGARDRIHVLQRRVVSGHRQLRPRPHGRPDGQRHRRRPFG